MEETDLKVAEMNKDAGERRERDYLDAVDIMKTAADLSSYKKALQKLTAIGDYKDSQKLAAKCQKEIERLNEEERIEIERRIEMQRQEAERAEKKKKTITVLVIGLLAVCIAGVFIGVQIFI